MALNFEVIYKEYYKHIYNYVYRRIGNHADTQDILAETFSALWQNWEQLKPEQPVKPFVFGIAHHKLVDHLRRYYKLEVEVRFAEDFTMTEDVMSNSRVDKYRSILAKLVTELPERERKFVELRYQQNLKLVEVAKLLEITENNAKVIQNRIIKKLKQIWQSKI